jgi:hypothetical protein
MFNGSLKYYGRIKEPIGEIFLEDMVKMYVGKR